MAARTLPAGSSWSERQKTRIQVNREKRFSGAIARRRLPHAVTVRAPAWPAHVPASVLVPLTSVVTPAVEEVQP